MATKPFQPGDTFTYRSVTGLHLVTWTRDDLGRWAADDGRDGFASDSDVWFNMGPDTTLSHRGPSDPLTDPATVPLGPE